MNAYDFPALRAQIDMLESINRQQADRIAELEKLLKYFSSALSESREYDSEGQKTIDLLLKKIVETPPQSKPLSDEEIRTIQGICHLKNVGYNNFIMRFARAIEAKVRGEK